MLWFICKCFENYICGILCHAHITVPVCHDLQCKHIHLPKGRRYMCLTTTWEADAYLKKQTEKWKWLVIGHWSFMVNLWSIYFQCVVVCYTKTNELFIETALTKMTCSAVCVQLIQSQSKKASLGFCLFRKTKLTYYFTFLKWINAKKKKNNSTTKGPITRNTMWEWMIQCIKRLEASQHGWKYAFWNPPIFF